MDGTTTSINSILKNLIKNFNTLLDCPARFSGEFNEQKVHCFIEYIEYYKRFKCIRDEQALQELQHLLLDHAYNWWMRRKESIETWSEALTILENQYSKKRPANKVFEEILRRNYEDYQSKYDFLDDKIELFNELSQAGLSERNKLDIIYALLPIDVQNKIKHEDVTSVKDLKKHLKLVQSEIEVVPSDQLNAVSNSQTETTPNRESDCQEINNQISLDKNSNGDSTREPIIKVRRAEDLMCREIKEDKIVDEGIPDETKSSDTNDLLRTGHDNFQIDSDIMSQINNIIDETERSIEAMSNNEDDSSTLPQSPNSAVTLELLGFQIEAAKQNESANHQTKSNLNYTKKTKKRCSYCRHFNHTAQECLKRAKCMKLFPERFLQEKSSVSNSSTNEKNNERPSETLPSNIPNNTSFITTQTEISAVASNITNPPSNITATDSSTVVTSYPMILNNVPERSIISTMTTKLIPAINGKAPNKALAAKLRNMSSPSPKCHQCGTVGFYKSICPNCSPIYNNTHK